MSGQGAVGVVVSSVQVMSAVASVWSTSSERIADHDDYDGTHSTLSHPLVIQPTNVCCSE